MGLEVEIALVFVFKNIKVVSRIVCERGMELHSRSCRKIVFLVIRIVN